MNPNEYDPGLANLAVVPVQGDTETVIDVSAFLKVGQAFRLVDPRDFYGEPVLRGICKVTTLKVPAMGEYACYILMREEVSESVRELVAAEKLLDKEDKMDESDKALKAAETVCRRLMGLAKTFIVNEDYDRARPYLEKVIKEYPGTEYAKQAEEKLQELK